MTVESTAARKPRRSSKRTSAVKTTAKTSAKTPQSSEPELVQLLTPEGERVEHPDYSIDLTADELRGLYRDMVLTRRFDAEATALQRQGELGLWASLLGQEAAQIGSGRALRDDDYVFPTYREHGVAWCRGVDPTNLLGMFRGVNHGGWDPNSNNFHLYTIVIGSQTLHATGYAMGVAKDGADSAVIAYFGDGASSQGDVAESFTFSAVYNAPVVFFCQNNQWAISEPTEKQTRVPLYQRAQGFGFPGVRVDGNDVLACLAVTKSALERARRGEGPTLVEAFTYRMGAHTTSDDPTKYRADEERASWEAKDPILRLRVPGEGGRRRRGVLHRAGRGERGARQAGARGGTGDARPRPDRDLRQRLRRREPARRRGARPVRRLSGIVRRHRRGEQVAMAMEKMSIAKALNESLRKALDTDPKVLIMGEDVGKLGGVFRITDGLQKDFGEERVIDTPLAESGIVGTAIGLALRGYRPVVEIQFDGFVFPAYDQIVTQLAKMHARALGKIKLPVVIRIPYGGGIGAVEHHSESPEALFAHVAGLKVVSPSNASDAYWMMQQAVQSDDPVIFFEPKRRYWDKGEVETDSIPGPLHKASVARTGTDLTLAAYGPMVKVCLEAAAAAQEEGKSIEVLDLRSMSPIDFDAIQTSVEKTGRLVVVHEAPVFYGSGAEIAARITERCFYHLEAPVLRVGGYHAPYPPARLEDEYLPGLDRVLDAVDRSLAY